MTADNLKDISGQRCTKEVRKNVRNNSELFRSVITSPFAATDNNGEVVDLENLLSDLKEEITLITDLAEMNITLENKVLIEEFLGNRKAQGLSSINNSVVAQRLDINFPKEFHYSGKSGRSRVSRLFGARVVSECKSWIERCKAVEEKSDKYISQGWKRTVCSYKPQCLSPKINLGDADNNYCKISTNSDVLALELVIQGKWYKLYFDYDKRLSQADDIAKPSVFLDKKGRIHFSFPTVYKYNFAHFSARYVVGIDVGITNYVSAVVYDVEEKRIVTSTTLSQRVHSISNKVKRANVQVASLQEKGRKNEAALHRAANSRRKKELAILAAQEIAHLSYTWDNAIVVYEDLSWIANTMSNGRWNRGELVKRTTEQVELNGGRTIKTSCYNTSQLCHKCDKRIVFREYHTVICNHCNTEEDRDINAAANIAKKILHSKTGAKSTFSKMTGTRNTKKNSKNTLKKRSKNGTGKPLKFPGRDRAKNKPTPNRPKREVKTPHMCSAQNNNDSRVALDVSHSSDYGCMTVTGSTKVCTCGYSYTLTRCSCCATVQ